MRQIERHFPGIYVEPPTLKHLQLQQAQQRQQFDLVTKPALKKIGDMQRRLELMSEVVQKDLVHAKCLQEYKKKKFYEQCVRKTLHSKRLADARAHRYFHEYEIQQKLKLQQARTQEEQIFIKAVEGRLRSQNEELRCTQRCANEKLQSQISKQLEVMECWYPLLWY